MAPLYILGILSGFFRDLILARSQAGEGNRSREQIFAELKPRYVKACPTFPSGKCAEFFALAERKDLPRFLEDLEEIDRRLKTTDSSPRPLFEAFVWDFCRGGAARITSPARGRSFRSGG
jgi:DNA polymerase III delta subunit